MTDDERTNGLVSPAQTDTEPVSETVPNLCDHYIGTYKKADDEWEAFTYCPKCGVKL